MFFQHYHSRLLRIAFMFVSSPQVAEDVVSEVLIKLLKNRKETFNKSNFIGYLYQSIKNQCFDQLKKNNKQPTVDINYNDADYFVQDTATPHSVLVHREFELLIVESVEGMPPKRKMVFKLIKDDGLSYKEVAGLLDISERTVEVHLRLAIAHLKAVIDKYLDQSGDTTSGHLRMVKVWTLLFYTLSLTEQDNLMVGISAIS